MSTTNWNWDHLCFYGVLTWKHCLEQRFGCFVEYSAKEKLWRSWIHVYKVIQMCVMVFHAPLFRLPSFDVALVRVSSSNVRFQIIFRMALLLYTFSVIIVFLSFKSANIKTILKPYLNVPYNGAKISGHILQDLKILYYMPSVFSIGIFLLAKFEKVKYVWYSLSVRAMSYIW